MTRNDNIIGFDNYKTIFQTIDLQQVLDLQRLIVWKISIGFLVASIFKFKSKKRCFLKTSFFFPAVLNTVTVGLIFSQMFNNGLSDI